jgi:EAL and modified HD-GYP domain-containing signal transduction protein
MMIEVPAFVAADPANSDALLELAARDCALLLKGRPLRELPRLVLPCFKWSIVDLADERRTSGAEAPRGVTRTIPHIQSGVRTMAELRRSFALGAVAVIGWPLHEPIGDAAEARPDPSVVHAAIQHIDEDPSAKSVDHVLMRDPVLAFELLRHVNAADALSIETGSLRHAVSMMGQANLRRWLARMLSRGADGSSLRPVNFAALRRGLLMRMLAVGTGQPEARGELFMCGVLSLLDRIYARPMGELVRSLTLPEGVRAALVDRSGPYFPLLKLARTIEAEVPHDIREAADAAFIPPAEINRALLRSLLVASQLERPTAAPVGRHVDGARAPAAPMHT